MLDHPAHKTMNHDAITKVMTSQGEYGTGVTPNPYAKQQNEWERRKKHGEVRTLLTDKIVSLFEPRFITPPETSELIEAIVTSSDARRVLEVGTHTGFTSLHILRALYGKKDAKLTAIDARPAHDKAFWSRPEFKECLEFIEGWTPQVLDTLKGQLFDLVFVDSDHSVEHTVKELGALWNITRKGSVFLFHDVPEWQTPTNRVAPPVRDYLFTKIQDGIFHGVIIPTPEQLDCLDVWGAGYPQACNPHLGVFIRR